MISLAIAVIVGMGVQKYFPSVGDYVFAKLEAAWAAISSAISPK